MSTHLNSCKKAFEESIRLNKSMKRLQKCLIILRLKFYDDLYFRVLQGIRFPTKFNEEKYLTSLSYPSNEKQISASVQVCVPEAQASSSARTN